MLPYFEKYNATEYLKPLTERIEYLIMEYKLDGSCGKALLLDYKAELLLPKKEYTNICIIASPMFICSIKNRTMQLIAFRLRKEYSDLGTVAQHRDFPVSAKATSNITYIIHFFYMAFNCFRTHA